MDRVNVFLDTCPLRIRERTRCLVSTGGINIHCICSAVVGVQAGLFFVYRPESRWWGSLGELFGPGRGAAEEQARHGVPRLKKLVKKKKKTRER